MVDIEYKIKKSKLHCKDMNYDVFFKHKEEWKWAEIMEKSFRTYEEALAYVKRLEDGVPEPKTATIYYTAPNNTVHTGGGGGGAYKKEKECNCPTAGELAELKLQNASYSKLLDYKRDTIKSLRTQVDTLTAEKEHLYKLYTNSINSKK